MNVRGVIGNILLASVVAILVSVGQIRAEEANGGVDGWLSLFDGKSLKGWRADENGNAFNVEKGLLTVHGKRGCLYYTGPVQGHSFQNFEFRTEVKTTPGANAGVFFHTVYQAAGQPNQGYKVQINNLPLGAEGGRASEKTGSLSAVRNIFKSPAEDGKWFLLSVRVEGRTVVIKVDGQTVVEYMQPDQPVRLSGREGRMLSRGTFALQAHDPDGRVDFRNIYIRPLPDGKWPEDKRPQEEIYLQKRITKYHAEGFPLIDYHVHLKGGLTLEDAMALSSRLGIGYGVAVNCGLGFPVQSDEGAKEFFKSLEGRPVFRAMQAEGREWVTMFSKEVIAQFDYVFTDAMTFHDRQGRRTRLWMPDEVFIDDPQDFMEMYVEKIEGILNNEKIDIYVNPTYLPEVIRADYDTLWTPERMDRVIRALVSNNVAMEINSRHRIPSAAFIKRAKAAGVKFSLGTNNTDYNLGHLEYSLDMVDQCGLKKIDMFVSRQKVKKKTEMKTER